MNIQMKYILDSKWDTIPVLALSVHSVQTFKLLIAISKLSVYSTKYLAFMLLPY